MSVLHHVSIMFLPCFVQWVLSNVANNVIQSRFVVMYHIRVWWSQHDITVISNMYHTTGRPTTLHNKLRRRAWPWYVFLAGQSWVTHKHVKCQLAILITSPVNTCLYPAYQKQNKIICSPTLCLCHALMSPFTSQHDTHTKSVNDLSEHK